MARWRRGGLKSKVDQKKTCCWMSCHKPGCLLKDMNNVFVFYHILTLTTVNNKFFERISISMKDVIPYIKLNVDSCVQLIRVDADCSFFYILT